MSLIIPLLPVLRVQYTETVNKRFRVLLNIHKNYDVLHLKDFLNYCLTDKSNKKKL